MLRHERMSVAMALAESTHHSAQRQKTARAGGEARVVLHGHVPEAPLPQGSRPPCLCEPRGPQDQDQLRTMEQAAAYAPMVQILDIPVPQLVDQLADVMRFFDKLQPVPEQAIDVPKILLDDVPVRTPVRVTQLVEQLVKCRRSYPILPCGGLRSRTSTLQFLIVEGDTLVFKVFLPDRVQQRRLPPRNAFLSGLWSRSSIFPVEAFKIFAQDRVHPLLRTFQLVLTMLWMRLVMGFFRTFPQNKKSAKSGSHSGSELLSTPSPQPRVRHKQWVMILDEHGLYFWNMDTRETRRQMEEGFNPRWWLPDGQYFDLGDLAF